MKRIAASGCLTARLKNEKLKEAAEPKQKEYFYIQPTQTMFSASVASRFVLITHCYNLFVSAPGATQLDQPKGICRG